jgi:hypothetical protein
MARRVSEVPTEPLIPIDVVALRCRQNEETIWRRMEALGWKAVPDWDHTWCMPRSQAAHLFEEITGATTEYERVERQRREQQMADEHEGRMQPVRAYEAALASEKGKVHGGVQVFGPDDPTPGWAEEDDD